MYRRRRMPVVTQPSVARGPRPLLTGAAVTSLGLVWGCSYVFTALALRGYSPTFLTFARETIAGALLLPAVVLQRQKLRMRNRLGWIALGSVLMILPTLLIAIAQRNTTASVAGLVVAATPLFTVPMLLVMDRDWQRLGVRVLGSCSGLAGVGVAFSSSLREGSSTTLALALLVVAACMLAAGGLVVNGPLRDVPRASLVAVMTAFSAVLLAPAGIADMPAAVPSEWLPTAALIELGLIATAAGWLAYFAIIRAAGPQAAASILYVAPVSAVCFGALFLAEPFTTSLLLGLILVVGGVVITVHAPI